MSLHTSAKQWGIILLSAVFLAVPLATRAIEDAEWVDEPPQYTHPDIGTCVYLKGWRVKPPRSFDESVTSVDCMKHFPYLMKRPAKPTERYCLTFRPYFDPTGLRYQKYVNFNSTWAHACTAIYPVVAGQAPVLTVLYNLPLGIREEEIVRGGHGQTGSFTFTAASEEVIHVTDVTLTVMVDSNGDGRYNTPKDVKANTLIDSMVLERWSQNLDGAPQYGTAAIGADNRVSFHNIADFDIEANGFVDVGIIAHISQAAVIDNSHPPRIKVLIKNAGDITATNSNGRVVTIHPDASASLLTSKIIPQGSMVLQDANGAVRQRPTTYVGDTNIPALRFVAISQKEYFRITDFDILISSTIQGAVASMTAQSEVVSGDESTPVTVTVPVINGVASFRSVAFDGTVDVYLNMTTEENTVEGDGLFTVALSSENFRAVGKTSGGEQRTVNAIVERPFVYISHIFSRVYLGSSDADQELVNGRATFTFTIDGSNRDTYKEYIEDLYIHLFWSQQVVLSNAAFSENAIQISNGDDVDVLQFTGVDEQEVNVESRVLDWQHTMVHVHFDTPRAIPAYDGHQYTLSFDVKGVKGFTINKQDPEDREEFVRAVIADSSNPIFHDPVNGYFEFRGVRYGADRLLTSGSQLDKNWNHTTAP